MCKSCKKKNISHEDFLNYYRAYRAKNRIKLRLYNRHYNKEWRRQFGYHSEVSYKIRNPEKVKAQQKVHYAIKEGKLKKRSCQLCNFPKAQAHHPDYNQPLQVIWLCPPHHKELHLKLPLLEINKKLGV